MAGWKQWLSGEVVEHTEFQTYLQNQVVQVYAGTAARSSALGTAVSEGMVAYLEDTNKLELYNGSAWLEIAITGGTVAYATNSGTAVYATNSGTAVYATNSGTAVYANQSGTAAYASLAGTADYSTTSGTAVYSTTSGTAVFSSTSGTASYATLAGTATFADQAGTATTISGSIAKTQVTGTAVTLGDTATVTNAMLAGSIENNKLVNSQITLNGSAVALGGSLTISGTGFSNPMTTLGDLIVGEASGVAGRLGIGAANTFLFSNGTVASWNTVGTASYSTTSGTSVSISGSITKTQVDGTAVTLADTATVTNTMLAGSIANNKLSNSSITLNGSAVSLGGTATINPYSMDGYESETYYAPVHIAAATGATPTESTTYYSAFYVSKTTTFDRIACRAATGFSGTATVRLGIYNNGGSIPTTVVLDAGTVSVTAAGTFQITISQELSPGWYWLAFNSQTNATTNTFSHIAPVPTWGYMMTTSALNRFQARSQTGVTGAFDTATGLSTASITSVPSVLLRAV